MSAQTATVNRQPPVKLICRTENELSGDIDAESVWPWVQELRAHGFLVTLSPRGLDAQRADQRVHLRVREGKE